MFLMDALLLRPLLCYNILNKFFVPLLRRSFYEDWKRSCRLRRADSGVGFFLYVSDYYRADAGLIFYPSGGNHCLSICAKIGAFTV